LLGRRLREDRFRSFDHGRILVLVEPRHGLDFGFRRKLTHRRDLGLVERPDRHRAHGDDRLDRRLFDRFDGLQHAGLAVEFLHRLGQAVAATGLDGLEQRVQHGAQLLVVIVFAGAGGLEFLDRLGLLGDRGTLAVDLGLLDRGLGRLLFNRGGLLLDLALLVADAPFDSVHQNHQAFAVCGALRVVQAEALLGGQNPLAQFLHTSHDSLSLKPGLQNTQPNRATEWFSNS
jgi:hypothetical protein